MRGIWLLAAGLLADPALAQRVDNNATTQAEDAFGKSVGDESIGIYSASNVRGFSPTDVGNVRIEGLYFDQQAELIDRLSDSSTIRVGPSAQSYPFPAPTGIADLTLRRPGAKPFASAAIEIGPWKNRGLDVDLQLPIDKDKFGIAFGGTLDRGADPDGVTYPYYATAAVVRWAPNGDTEILPFWSYATFHGELTQPLIFTSGAFLPRRIPRATFLGQRFADNSGNRTNFGVLAKTRLGDFDIRLGVFRSIADYGKSSSDLLYDTDPSGLVGDRQIIIENDDRSASTSGELRVQRGFSDGARHHMLIASVRARSLDRSYGGYGTIDLGPSTSIAQDFRTITPAIQAVLDAPEPKTHDRVRQETAGVAYQGKWDKIGEITLNLQKTHYTKQVIDPDQTVVFPESKSEPWLPSVTAALYVTRRLAAYGSWTRGLEESPVAPSNAVNLNQAPPAIRTEQKDAGLRWTVKPGLTAVVGVFDIAKPYFNIDGADFFRQLGRVRNRGVEFSIAGRIAKGLNIVVGNVLIDARVSGEEVASGLIGSKPVGSFVRHTIASVNYDLPWVKGLSVDVYGEGTSRRIADAPNSYAVPARAVLFLGTRYRFTEGKTKFLLRAQVQNVFDKYGWNIGSSGYFVPNGSRRYLLELAADL